MQAIEDAHSEAHGHVNWDHAEMWAEAGAANGARLAPSFIRHVADKQGARNLIEKEKRKAHELKKLAPTIPRGRVRPARMRRPEADPGLSPNSSICLLAWRPE